MPSKNAVLLVDHRDRDLKGCALIAKHLEDAGVVAHLEPIDAWQAVLPAHKPDFILFNHTNREHLADYTQSLAKMGVLTGVLPNEGLLYNEQVRAYNSQRLPNLHLDYYFCWNDPHRECLLASGYKGKTDVVTVGVPRFDFYFDPWKRVFNTRPRQQHSRPRLLLCTNFGFAEWRDRPKEITKRFFSQWTHLPAYADYENAIEVNYRSRIRFLDYLKAILESGKFEVVLKTHPRETRQLYETWIKTLPGQLQKDLNYVPSNSNITELIIECDLEISCEKCTTAMESWIAGKPTIELVFEKHPLFYDPAVSALNSPCHSPEEIVSQIESQLANPAQPEFAELRRAHLAKWCHSPNGNAASNVAHAIAEAINRNEGKKRLQLGFNDYRRGLKLKTYRAIGQPYTYYPLQQLTHRLPRSSKFSKKMMVYEKSVRPADARKMIDLLNAVEERSQVGNGI